MRRRGLNIRKGLLRIVLPAIRRLPPRAAARMVARIGRVEYALVRGVRERIDAALAEGQAHFACRWDAAAVGPELAGNQVRWRTRDQLLDGVPDARLGEVFEVVGREHLDAAAAERKGVILLANHFGAHMMPAHWLVRRGYPVRLFMERPHSVSAFLRKHFESDGPLGQRKLFISRKPDPTEAAGSILRAARVLKAGMIIKIAGDVRWTGAHTAAARFLGRDYTFSATWVALAALSGAPVVPAFCRMEAEGGHTLEFQPAFRVAPDAPKSGAVGHYVQGCLDAIAGRVRLDPGNSNEYLFWDEPNAPIRGPRVATAATRPEAVDGRR